MNRRKIKFDDHPELPFEEWETRPVPKRPSAHIYDKARIEHPYVANIPERDDNRLFYVSLASGSSGNSCYVGTSKGGVLIDAGIKPDEIERRLEANGINLQMVKGIMLTHDHGDHTKYVYAMLRHNRHMSLYCTNRVRDGLLKRHNMSKRINDYLVPVFKEIPFRVGELDITAFEVSHDGVDNVGFSIEFDDRHFVIATDLGTVTPRARHYISKANYLVLESNYDSTMLTIGRYPEYLKARIRSDFGHMDNDATASFLREIYTEELKYIFLCHLSRDNNTPAKAVTATRNSLEAAGLKVGRAEETLSDRKADVQLMALPRSEASRLFVFRPIKSAT